MNHNILFDIGENVWIHKCLMGRWRILLFLIRGIAMCRESSLEEKISYECHCFRFQDPDENHKEDHGKHPPHPWPAARAELWKHIKIEFPCACALHFMCRLQLGRICFASLVWAMTFICLLGGWWWHSPAEKKYMNCINFSLSLTSQSSSALSAINYAVVLLARTWSVWAYTFGSRTLLILNELEPLFVLRLGDH